MVRLRIHCFSISLDGYGAGPRQDRDSPLGVGGLGLHEWIFPTRFFRAMDGDAGGETGIDNDFAARGATGLGAGESLLEGLDLPALGYTCTEHVPTARATHVVLTRRTNA